MHVYSTYPVRMYRDETRDRNFRLPTRVPRMRTVIRIKFSNGPKIGPHYKFGAEDPSYTKHVRITIRLYELNGFVESFKWPPDPPLTSPVSEQISLSNQMSIAYILVHSHLGAICWCSVSIISNQYFWNG